MNTTEQKLSPAQDNVPPLRAWMRLLFVLALGATLWGIALPWLSQQPAIAEHIEQLRAQNIDPSARYYSDLETLPPIVHRLERLHTTNHAELWGQ